MTTFSDLLGGSASPGIFAWRGDPDRDLLAEASAQDVRALSLDTRRATSLDDVHAAVARDWSLPGWFGRNLDALWDVLGDLTAEPLLVVWDGMGDLAQVDPDAAVVLLGLLRDASTQAEWFAVVVRGADELSELDALL